MASEIVFPTGFIHQKFDSGLILSEVLFFPELSRVGAKRATTIDALQQNLTKRLEQANAHELYFRRLGTTAETRWITVTLEPPLRQLAWQEPVTLRFPVVVWQHGNEAYLTRIPGLQLEVIVDKIEALDDALQRDIPAALRRTGLAAKLPLLVSVQRTTQFRVEWDTLTVKIPSLKHKAQKLAEENKDDKNSVLKQTATLLNNTDLRPAFEMTPVVEQIAEALTAARPQSVLLIGPSGVGKTACVRELVRQREHYRLAATPFYQTSGARLVAGQCGFGMWQERCKELVREASKKRAILHLGNIVELMEVGKSEYNHTGIAGFLRPFIARGELLCIAECTPEQLPMLEREDPQLVDAFRAVRLTEPDPVQGRRILEQYATDWRRGLLAKDVASPTPEALTAIDRLHRRYATYSAFPGRPIRFLDNLRRDRARGTTFGEPEVLQAFTRETGLPHVLLDPTIPLDVAQTRRWFAERVIGQTEAVDLVTDLLATIKAGLTRPNRPIASLLFIGPTGVGKTEMAKALAEFLFGSKERLTRFDMSEYADAISVQRLAGTAFGSEGLLTAKVREQPFCVLLLDEFEKAHPAFLDLMLQVLGEARLTDAGGRLADFRNAVIILTSNLGAESFQMGQVGFGTALHEQREAKQHFIREVEKFLRPEMFNRLDRLVPFAPLDAATIDDIAEREWAKVLQRDGVRFRGVTVNAAHNVVPHLAQKGFDPRYGARPLKRAIERELLAPLAHQMNRYSAEIALEVRVATAGQQLTTTVKPRQEAGRVVEVLQTTGTAAELLQGVQYLRRCHQLLASSSVVRELENEVYQLEQIEKKLLHRKKQRAMTQGDQQRLAKLGRLRELVNDVRRQRQDSIDLEDSVAFAFHRQQPQDAMSPLLLDTMRTDWNDLLLQLFALQHPKVKAISLVLFSEERRTLGNMADAYVAVAQKLGFRVAAERYEIVTQMPPLDHSNNRREATFENPAIFRWGTGKFERYYFVDKYSEPLTAPLLREEIRANGIRGQLSPQTIGIGLRIMGDGANVRFLREHGVHLFHVLYETESTPKVLATVTSDDLTKYLPPDGITRRGALGDLAPTRTYRQAAQTVHDKLLDLHFRWNDTLEKALELITARHMQDILQELVLE